LINDELMCSVAGNINIKKNRKTVIWIKNHVIVILNISLSVFFFLLCLFFKTNVNIVL